MAQQEYFVRQPDSENARGPYNIEKLVSLAEAGQVDTDTLYYDDQQESWVDLVSSEELKAAVFPEKKKLGLKMKTEAEIGALNTVDRSRPAVTVDHMLAAAEGETEETRHLKERMRWEERTASAVLPLLSLTMLLSALALIYPIWKLIEPLIYSREEADWTVLLKQPLPLIGFVDLLFALLLGLAVTKVYPVLRFRMMLGLGFFGFSAYAAFASGLESGLLLMAASALFSVGVFVATITLNFTVMLASVGCAIVGIVAYGLLTIFPDLF